MAKVRNCIFCILFLYACNSSGLPEAGVESKLDSAKADMPVQVDTTYADTAKAVVDTLIVDTIAEKNIVIAVQKTKSLQSIYTSFVGVREKTGNNDGPEVEMFLHSVGLGKGYAWCAAFVKYCMLEAGIKSAERMNGMALSCENKKNMVFQKGIHLKEAMPGDVFTLYYARLGRIGHTGFFDKPVNSSVFETVEGNTNMAGSREGDGVYRKKRSYNAIYSISRWE